MPLRKPKLTIKQILGWADHHYKHTGRWPIAASGTIPSAPHEVWRRINSALEKGLRGLPGGSSLARLLAEQRNAWYGKHAPRLTTKQVLAWADAHHKRTGKWPSQTTGPVVGTRTETWSNINQCLQGGLRGLPSGVTLSKLLVEKRHMISRGHRPKLTSKQILLWADQHHRRTGQWPKQTSGAVAGTRAENWAAISHSLLSGFRGLPGGSTIAKLLYVKRAVTSQRCQQSLSVARILAWARAHYRRTGKWPTIKAGAVAGEAGENWQKIDRALRDGARGLPGGSTLARMLDRHRILRNKTGTPTLTIRNILVWAYAHYRRTGAWPSANSGRILEAPANTWSAINRALIQGTRDRAGGSSLAQLLAKQRRA